MAYYDKILDRAELSANIGLYEPACSALGRAKVLTEKLGIDISDRVTRIMQSIRKQNHSLNK